VLKLDQDLGGILKQSAKGSFILMLGQILSTIILAIGVLIVANLLIPGDFGLLNTAMAPVSIAMIFQDMGVNSALIKYISQNRYEKKRGHLKVILESGLILTFITSFMLAGIVYTFSGFLAERVYGIPELGPLIRYLSLLIVGQSFLTTAYGITVGYERMELRSGLQIFYSFMKSIAAPLLVYIGYGVFGAILGELVPVLITGAFGLFFILLIYLKERPFSGSLSLLDATKMIILYSSPLFFARVLSGIQPHVYTSLLAVAFDEVMTGNWNAVIRFSALLAFVTMPISTTLFPLFSKLENQIDELKFIYQNSVKFSTLFAYPIAVAIMVLSDQIAGVLLSDYEYASTFLRLYMLTFIWIGIGSNSNGALLNSHRMTRENFQITVIQSLITIPASFFVIPRYGVNGLIGLLFIGGFVANLFSMRIIWSSFNFCIDIISFIKLLASAVLTFLISQILVNRLSLNPWIEIFLGGAFSFLVYFIAIILLRVLDDTDIGYLCDISDSLGPLSAPLNFILEIIRKCIHLANRN
jgi:O-antigen/teichoic acid export membrane protein